MFFLYKGAVWVANKVVMPVVQKHLDFLDKLELSNEKQIETCMKIGVVQDKILKYVETKQELVQQELHERINGKDK